MYQADQVPVGEDQRQHLELTRDLAQRFNARYGQTFTRARAVHRQGHREDLRPAGPDREDEQVASSPAGVVDLLDDAEGVGEEDQSAVTDTEREIRYDPASQARALEPAVIYSALTGRPSPSWRASTRARATAT